VGHYHTEMESQFDELQLCSNHWKANQIWIYNYSSWYASAKNNKSVEDDPIEISDAMLEDEDEKKRKRKRLLEKKTTARRKHRSKSNSRSAEEATIDFVGDNADLEQLSLKKQKVTASSSVSGSQSSAPSGSEVDAERPKPKCKTVSCATSCTELLLTLMFRGIRCTF